MLWNGEHDMSDKQTADVTLERIKELKGTDSQEVFANKINTTQSNVSKMFKGTPPSAATLKALAQAYSVSVDWLLGLSDKKEIGDKNISHELTAETVTYADAMAVLEVLYQKESIDVGYDMNGYNNELDPNTILVRDKILAYFLDNRLRYNGGSRDIYDIWLEKAMQHYSNQLLVRWTKTTDDIFEQNKPNPMSDDAIMDLIDDIENGRVEVVQNEGFMNIPDSELPFN